MVTTPSENGTNALFAAQREWPLECLGCRKARLRRGKRTLKAAAMPENSSPTPETPLKPTPSSMSWAAMLGLVLLAILVAAGCAYLLVSPFFHQHPR